MKKNTYVFGLESLDPGPLVPASKALDPVTLAPMTLDSGTQDP